MDVLAPIAVEKREYSLPLSTRFYWAVQVLSGGTLAGAGVYDDSIELLAAGVIWCGAATAFAVLKRPKVVEVVDCEVLAVTAPNKLTVKKVAGGRPFEVIMRNTELAGGADLQQRGMEHLNKLLKKGVVEVNQITGTATTGYQADITVRSVWPDKNGHHTHSDTNNLMIKNGFVIVAEAAIATPKQLKAMAEAKQKGRGYWGLMK